MRGRRKSIFASATILLNDGARLVLIFSFSPPLGDPGPTMRVQDTRFTWHIYQLENLNIGHAMHGLTKNRIRLLERRTDGSRPLQVLPIFVLLQPGAVLLPVAPREPWPATNYSGTLSGKRGGGGVSPSIWRARRRRRRRRRRRQRWANSAIAKRLRLAAATSPCQNICCAVPCCVNSRRAYIPSQRDANGGKWAVIVQLSRKCFAPRPRRRHEPVDSRKIYVSC